MYKSHYGVSSQSEMKHYDRICSMLLNMAKDEDTKQKMGEILYNGQYCDYVVDTNLTNKGNISLEMHKRASIAYILATTPETFDMLSQNNINLFHGTNIYALPSILSYGINSFDELSKKGIEVSTGEDWSRRNGGRNFISFTDDLKTALDYASIKPLSEDSQNDNSFGILIGISSNDINKLQTRRIISDTPEIGIVNNVPLEDIKIIIAPESKIPFVRKLVGNKPILVAPINIDEKFYYINGENSEIFIDDKKAEEFIQGKNEKKKSITFNAEDIRNLASKRKFSGIKNIYESIKEIIQKEFQMKGKDIENDSRQ